MKTIFFSMLILGTTFAVCAQQKQDDPRIPNKNDLVTYRLSKNPIYKDGWIDFNKNGKKDIYEDPNALVEDRIEDLLRQMTVEEKTCQMVTLYGYKRVLDDELPTSEWKNKLWKDGMGAIDEHLNGFRQWGLPPSDNAFVWPASRHAWALNEVQRFFVEETRLGIPVDFTNEGIRGVESYIATNFPTQLGLGHTWNRDLIKKVGYITGREGRLLGYTNIYAPILDVGRDQRWGRYEEIYGECPYLVSELGVAMTLGMQTDYQVASTAKHFLAYSNNKGGREGLSRVDPQMSPREVENIHIYPWKKVIKKGGLLGAMSSYNDYDGFPVQSSYYWLMTRLRKDLGFKGYVVSDSDAVEYLHSKHGTSQNMKESVRQSVEAGLNVRCTFRSPDSYVLPLRELIAEGGLSMETIDERVRDVLRVKFMVGLFDAPYQMDLKAADREVNSVENQAVALQASRESIVLLKNEDNTLPLVKEQIKKISVCGPNADDVSYALSHYGPLAVEATSVLQGIKEKMQGQAEVLYTKGCDIVDANWPESEILSAELTDAEQAEIDKAVANALESDVAIVVLGENGRTCGENKSRSSLDLPGRQLDLLKAVYATGKPTILVIISGRPNSVNWADRHIPAILEAWYPGSQGGTAVADVIFGDYNPGGKLTVTFPKTVGQIPFNFPSKLASQVDGGRVVGLKGNMSRVNGALYPFGYGLSYTTFKYSDLVVTPSVITPKQDVTVRFNVTNTGDRTGDEIVQMYVRDIISSVTTYEKNLRGFERINLQPGETKEVAFTIAPEELSLYNKEEKWVVEPGDFRIMVGASSTDIRLSDTLTVIPYQDSKASGRNKKDTNAKWTGSKGDYLTIPVKDADALDRVFIRWAGLQKEPVHFEIQISSGGGQFLTVFSGKATKTEHMQCYKFNKTTVSDIRILITSGKASVAEVKIDKEAPCN
ncbi:glycoside hydrolase family 3 C-terminal domain-containing protein [uncultured Bacteroides sp.]|uniref:glycoside hydrolase family 3 C-terminal domain-containing protein n=1 Tax=uncultured Bacteroides sp. TaxID=162156 RepID=UPI0025E47ECE|nr:glycoside hydrolase family 3 C-terminal domain-containing protein [uncultured Bacteroides sp.]